VTTTLRECNDRGYECCILSDCTNGFDAQMVRTAMDTICAQDGLFGYVGHSSDLLSLSKNVFNPTPPLTPEEPSDDLPPIQELHRRYQAGLEDPVRIVHRVFDRIERYNDSDPAVWISTRSREDCVAAARALAAKYAGQPLPPLYGVPFGVKDNIDVEGIQTTAACDEYAYVAQSNAFAVQLLLDAGALFIGKLNMDQLATGLSGCRSPYGVPHSAYSKRHIAGGSSSGSAVAVAAGLVSFALGTDTAGSGRVPAALNGVVGLKPTKGTISARGVVPACKSLDTISIMAPTLADARMVWLTLDQHDPLDPYAKPPSSLPTWHIDFRGPREGGFTFATPPLSILETCSKPYQELFAQAVQTLRSCGGQLVERDYTPIQTAGDLLYNGSLLYERITSIGNEFLSTHLDALHPSTRAVFQAALQKKDEISPWTVFRDLDLQQRCTRDVQRMFENGSGIDVLLVSTTPCHPTIEEMTKDPLGLNSRLGMFTHAANVLDLCGVSVNAGWVEETETETETGGVLRLPFGVTFLGGMGYDGKILDIAAVFEEEIRVKGKVMTE
jgi:allophanate hydrolase